MFRSGVLSLIAFFLLACTQSPESPGSLEGTWRVKEPFPVTVMFRSGEMETMGTTKKVSYKKDGDQILVTRIDGVATGKTFSYTVVDANTIRSVSGTFHKVP